MGQRKGFFLPRLMLKMNCLFTKGLYSLMVSVVLLLASSIELMYALYNTLICCVLQKLCKPLAR